MADALEMSSRLLVVEGLQPDRKIQNCPSQECQESEKGLWQGGR